MAAPELFAPAFAVKVNNKKLEADITRNILDLTYTNVRDKIDSFSFTLANPYPELRWTHDQDLKDLFAIGNTVEIAMGYVDNLHLMIEGVITSSSPTFPSSGTPTVAIQGSSWLHQLSRERRQRTFSDRTDTEIVKGIAGEQPYNFSIKADDTKIKHAHVTKKNQTDYDFLLKRARNVGFELLIEGKTLIFRKPEYPKVYTLVWGYPSREYDVKSYMPLLDFKPTLHTKDQVTSVIVRGQHPETSKVFEGRAGKGDEGRKMGKGKTGAELAEGASGQGSTFILVNQPLRSKEEADQLARSIYQDKALSFVTGSGTTVGLPLLRSGQLVEIEGLGYRFSGEYYITQTTHSIGGNGYQTSFQVRRNAIND